MEPSGLNPQANPAVNQEYLTPSMSVGRGTPGVPGTTPLFPQGDEAPNIDCQNPADTPVAAWFNRPTLLSGCSMHVDATQRAALPGSMSGAAEQDGSSVRLSCNLPAGCTEVPISIFVYHRRKTGRGPMPWPPLSHTSTPVAAMPGVSEDSEDAASIQLATSDFLSLGRASNVGTNDMAMNPSELATPVNCNSEHPPMYSQPIGLDAEAPQTGMQTEDSQVSSSATVVCASNGKVESVLPVNSDESQGQQTKESTSVLAEGVTDHNMHKYQRTQKKLKTQSQLNDHTILLTPAAFKEMAFTKIGRQISGSENFETLQNKETPARVAKPRRKKHRAKVIREDNQGKKQKPTVTTPEVKSPNQNAKRSYVRKKRNLNSLENCSGPLGDQSILGGAQNAARSRTASVRRRLLFELGEQGVQGDQSSTGNSCQEVTPNQKPTVTTPEVKSPNQNAKRSYVRKKRILNSLENCSGPLSDQSIPGGAENAARSRTASVRRRLLFELGEQGVQGDQSSTGNSCHHLKEKLIHAESSSCSATTVLSTAQSGHVLHVDMENSVGGLAFYMSRELHKQLDEYLHLPEIAPKTTQEISPATSGCCSREPTRQQDNVGSTHDLDATSMGVSVTEGNTKHLELNCSTKDGFDMHGSDTYIPETASTESQVTKVSKVEKKEHRQHRESESSLTGPGDSIISRTASWMLAFCLAGGVTKKRSVRLRRKSFVSIMYSEKNNAQAFKNLPQSCMEAPYEKSCTKSVTRKRTPRARLRSGSSIQPNVVFSGATAGLSNSLVPFGGQMIVPYESPLLVKKQGHRAKVNLDSETTRVWNLLMGKATEPLDGADVDKERWWQQEREVFEGRANSFIARMRLVQGDRHFSPWKGSVVDSVVGVFLTQNVSDHLSSSAYMALAASFPVNSNCKDDIASQDNEEIISTSLGENVEELSITYNGNILVETQNKTSAYEFTKAENYSFYSKEPNEGFCGHQETVIGDRAQICPGFSMELTASIIKPPDIQFQKDMSSYQSVVISETILQSRLSLSSGKNYPPGNRVGSVVGAASQQLGSNFDGGNLLTGNDATTKEHECQRINSLAASVYDDGVGEREIPSTSMMYYPFISVDRQQPDVTNEPHVSTTSPNSSTGSASSLLKNGTTGKKLPLFMPSDDHTAQNNCSKTVISTQDSPESSTDLPVELHGDNITRFEASDLQEYESLSSTGGMIAETANMADVFTSYNRVMDKAAQASRPKKKRTTNKENTETIDWDKFRRNACDDGYVKGKEIERTDSVDWEAVRCADVHRIAHAIRERGMNNMLADRIQSFLNRLVRDHGSIDLEWLRDISPDSVKDYLLSIDGLGLKSVECVRLLTLQHLAFPVDTNVGRICVRLGWVPIQPLPESLQLHLLELYPVLETIQKYLWPRLCKLDQHTLYELHYHMITFGKVFCTKHKPNCNACPMRSECRHFASAFASARLALPAPKEKSLVFSSNQFNFQNGCVATLNSTVLPRIEGSSCGTDFLVNNSEPIIEEPASPREEERSETLEKDIEDYDTDTGLPIIRLNFEEFAHHLENCIKESSKDLPSDDIAKALVAISTEAASIPVPKLKNVRRLRTEHYVFELPDSHSLVQQLGLEKREHDDPSPYLLTIWMQDDIMEMSKASKPCSDSHMEDVRCTILVPCRTAMKGSFPLNGTYFQVNEVFADYKSSHNPIHVEREKLWNLKRRMVYFGTSVPSIFKGLTTEEVQQCFWRGFVCVRGFDMKTGAPKPLCPHLHLAASKLPRSRKSAETEQN